MKIYIYERNFSVETYGVQTILFYIKQTDCIQMYGIYNAIETDNNIYVT